MKLYQIIRQSYRAILANKGRSLLTILGIIIGIGSVIALISLGNGVQSSIGKQISTLGPSNITISPSPGLNANASNGSSGVKPGGEIGSRATVGQTTSTLTTTDLNSLEDAVQHPHIKEVSGNVSGSAIFTVNGGSQRFTVLGVSPAYADIMNLTISGGTFLTDANVKGTNQVAILGSQFATDVLGSTNVIGKTLQINNDTFKIIGVLKQANESTLANPNEEVFIPYTTAQTTFNAENLSTISVMADDQRNVDVVKSDIQTTLLANHHITDSKLADFSVFSSKDLLSAVDQITGILTSLLASIAAISLIVGGIGIMNIMLVSVTERTREIGLRKAVGAKTIDILIQFVIEAILLTLSGGFLGIGLGWAIGRGAARILNLTPIMTIDAILLAVGVSTIVGLVFGIYPAAKAARLNPIDALRYE